MTDAGRDDHPRRSHARRAGTASWLIALPIGLLTVAALAGLGLARGLPTPVAFGAALALTWLPVAGLARGRLAGRGTTGLAVALWGLAVLVALPAYFPGERAPATSRGLRAASAIAGEPVSTALGRAGAGLVGLLGRDPAPPPPAPDTARGDRIATSTSHAPRRVSAASASRVGPARPASAVLLPYEGDRSSLRIRVDVDGPELGEQVEMIFDTGATLTTLDRATLDRIGVTVPVDAPWVTLRTANGELEAPLVLVDAIWLGDEPVEWVTVAVCDGCTDAPAAGLLGLNTSQRFHVALDHDRRRIELTRRPGEDDRALDIGQWLQIRSRATRQWTGAVDVALTARNAAHRPIAEAVVDLTCGDQIFAIQIDDIPAGGERTTEISLPRGTDCSLQKVELARSHWVLDRF